MILKIEKDGIFPNRALFDRIATGEYSSMMQHEGKRTDPRKPHIRKKKIEQIKDMSSSSSP